MLHYKKKEQYFPLSVKIFELHFLFQPSHLHTSTNLFFLFICIGWERKRSFGELFDLETVVLQSLFFFVFVSTEPIIPGLFYK